MKRTHMNSTVKKIVLVPVLAGAIMVAGFGAALASEVTGTISSASSTPSYTDGSLVASVGTTTASSTVVAQSGQDIRVSRSGHRRAPYGGVSPSTVSDPIIIIDNGSVAPSGVLGTGGGYDPEAERAIAVTRSQSAGSPNEGALSPSDAVAYNSARGLANTDLTAVAGDRGLGNAKIWTAVVLGLALLGLAGYAVNALMSYRRDNDL